MRLNRFHTAQSLTNALAPNTWAEIIGQAKVARRLARFAEEPYATGFLFHGATGCGKNCTARVLAGALGCDITGGLIARQMSGYFDLCGAGLGALEVEARLQGAHYRALNPRGWKCVVVSEADKLKDDAKDRFNFALDNLPPSTVWVFTTNYLDGMDRRTVTRCELVEFETDLEKLRPLANEWLAALWKEAGRNHRPPTVDDFPLAACGGHLSFRALVLGLQTKLC